jgi:hypothetical protein
MDQSELKSTNRNILSRYVFAKVALFHRITFAVEMCADEEVLLAVTLSSLSHINFRDKLSIHQVARQQNKLRGL